MTNSVVEIQRFRVNRNAWKTNLTKEIIDLEDNLDQLFLIVGLKPHRIVTKDESEIDESTLVINNKRLRDNESAKNKQLSTSYETIIDEHFWEVDKAVSNICALITSVTEFDLPVPVQILLRLASRLQLLKWSDYKRKMTGSLSHRYVYTKSLNLIHVSLKLSKWISIVLGTNSLPFQTYINQNYLNILEWTGTSHLDQFDSASYFELRCHILSNISSMVETLSTNITLEPKQLKSLVEVEIIENLERLYAEDLTRSPIGTKEAAVNGTMIVQNGHQLSSGTTNQSLWELKDKHSVDALCCLERLFICYADFFEASIEHRVKSFVVQTCLRVYRDFERNVIGLAIRRQLIKLLETIANRPHATSTTELAAHIFELAEKIESDAEIKFIARRSIKVGLAHRPTIVSNYGVYSAYCGKLLTQSTTDIITTTSNEIEDDQVCEQASEQTGDLAKEQASEQASDPVSNQASDPANDQANEQANDEMNEQANEHASDQANDPQVQSYLSLFVDKPAN